MRARRIDGDGKFGFAIRLLAFAAVAAAGVAPLGCGSTPPPAEEPSEKSVLSIGGVRHGPLMMAPDRVPAGAVLESTVEAQTDEVLVQAALESGRRPVGETLVQGGPGRSMPFRIAIPPDARGTLLVRAIDRQGLYIDKEVEVVAPVAPRG